jgi:hypothetical protein
MVRHFMKRIATFVIGFSVVAMPAADFLARKDPEPDMAGLSLLFFGFFGLMASFGAFSWSTARARAVPHSVLAFCTGIVCAICFYAALGFVPRGLGLTPALGLSFALVFLVAWASPLLSRVST